MPGFAGIIGLSVFNERGEVYLERMVRCLAHEPHHVADSIADNRLASDSDGFGMERSGGAVQRWNAGRNVSLVFMGDEFGGAPSWQRRSGRRRESRTTAAPLPREGAGLLRKPERMVQRIAG